MDVIEGTKADIHIDDSGDSLQIRITPRHSWLVIPSAVIVAAITLPWAVGTLILTAGGISIPPPIDLQFDLATVLPQTTASRLPLFATVSAVGWLLVTLLSAGAFIRMFFGYELLHIDSETMTQSMRPIGRTKVYRKQEISNLHAESVKPNGPQPDTDRDDASDNPASPLTPITFTYKKRTVRLCKSLSSPEAQRIISLIHHHWNKTSPVDGSE